MSIGHVSEPFSLPLPPCMSKSHRFQTLTPHDTTVPNIALASLKMPSHVLAFNRALLLTHELMAQRVKIRVAIEVNVNYNGIRQYRRLRASNVLLSAPNAKQAELFINAVLEFAASLDGKWLTDPPKPSEPTPNAGK